MDNPGLINCGGCVDGSDDESPALLLLHRAILSSISLFAMQIIALAYNLNTNK